MLGDVGSGDYSTLLSIPAGVNGKATIYKIDGETVSHGETAFTVEASIHTIMKAERLVLNCRSI